MFQQIIALIVIVFFLLRLFRQKHNHSVNNAEFFLWLFFWISAAAAIIAIKWIDELLAGLGFSGRGIDVLFYLAVILLFYLVFRIRLKLERMEKNITKLSREMAISKEKNKK